MSSKEEEILYRWKNQGRLFICADKIEFEHSILTWINLDNIISLKVTEVLLSLSYGCYSQGCLQWTSSTKLSVSESLSHEIQHESNIVHTEFKQWFLHFSNQQFKVSAFTKCLVLCFFTVSVAAVVFTSILKRFYYWGSIVLVFTLWRLFLHACCQSTC